jgi:hypothetical protein
MPSVLIETGFLTNPSDETFLKNPDTQNKIAGEYGEKINAARSYDYQQLVAFLSKRYSEPGIH